MGRRMGIRMWERLEDGDGKGEGGGGLGGGVQSFPELLDFFFFLYFF